MNKMTCSELEEKLRELFEANYEFLKESSGHSINELMKERAFEQILMYWKKRQETILDGKISSIDISVSNQKNPNTQIPFSVEGKIDVLEKDGKLSLFDITTNSSEQIEGSMAFYKDELNLYAYEMEKAQSKDIENLFVLSTALPKDVKYALKVGDNQELERALEKWNPVVSIPHNKDTQKAALKKVGEVIEKITNCEFDPPPPADLKKKFKDGKSFYNHMCENCDIRKSCESYRNFKSGKEPHAPRKLLKGKA